MRTCIKPMWNILIVNCITNSCIWSTCVTWQGIDYKLPEDDTIGSKHVKVKVTLVQALRLRTGRTVHRGSRGIDLPFLDHGTRRGWGVNVTPRPLFTLGKYPVPIVQEAGWTPGPVWTGAKISPPSGFDPRTVQPVASRHTDWATRPTSKHIGVWQFVR